MEKIITGPLNISWIQPNWFKPFILVNAGIYIEIVPSQTESLAKTSNF